jgi:hypothetical protein
MSSGEMAYLVMVVGAVSVFIIVVGAVSIWSNRGPRP